MANKPFPVPNSTTSFWRSGDLHDLDSYQSEVFPAQVDVVIVGAGYAGASLAHHLLEKQRNFDSKLSIAILEAREACSGATGRNGGHLKPDPYSRAGSALKTHGKKAAEEVVSFEFRHLKAIGDLIKRGNIDCDFFLTRATDVCLYDKARDEIKAKLDSLTTAGISAVDDVFYSSESTAEAVSGVKGARGAFSCTSAHLYPYKLISHLLAQAVSEGVNLQTHTPVTSVSSQSDSGGLWTIGTPRGYTKATNIIYASNGYTSALLPEFKDKIVPVRGICSRIITPDCRPPLLSNAYVLRFSDWEYDYLIPRTDGSIVVGGARRDYHHDLKSWFGDHDDSSLMESASEYFDGYMQRHFHGWEESGAKTDRVWTGIMGYTTDGYPFVGEVPSKPGQYICAGFNGHGMPQVFLSAKAVAAMVAEGRKPEETDLPMLYRSSQERLDSETQHVSLTAYYAFMSDRQARL
ncbi:hypothetical protein LTR37_008621 [Vermiconidia calcicola]|uniref:Uncharacterized protein n=1 Tax=Vermiconidia calcicola TaxID=1690605 RepID=A0ACC3NAA9_9PEZI|nr:hypothetical protein LTR37_008621 [Vermiconidia calcicola]